MFVNLHSHAFTAGINGAAGRWGPHLEFDENGYHHVRVGEWHMVQSTPETRRRVAEGWKVDPEELLAMATDPAARIAKMDKRGYDKLVVSLPVHFLLYWAEPEVGVPFATVVNDELAGFCSHDPSRLMFWAHVPLQDPQEAAKEADRAIRQLGAKGVLFGGANLGGRDVDDPAFYPLWDVLTALDAPIFVHGYTQAEARGAMGEYDKYEITTAVGFSHDETQCFYNLIAGGVLDEFSDLKVYITHGGGYVPYHLGRLAAMIDTIGDGKNKRPMWDYLGNFYFDLELESAAMRRAVVADIEISQLLYGDNFPGSDGVWELDLVADVGLDEAGKAAVLGGNAAALLKL